MKVQLFSVCAVLVVVASFGACYGATTPAPASPTSMAPAPEAAGAGPAPCPGTCGGGNELHSGQYVVNAHGDNPHPLRYALSCPLPYGGWAGALSYPMPCSCNWRAGL